MKEKDELPATGYAVIRCHDNAVIAKFDSFPADDRKFTQESVDGSMLVYFRAGTPVSSFWLRSDEFVTSLKTLDEVRKKAGLTAIEYRRKTL